MGPPLEYESISFFASSKKLRAADNFSFSGLEISELHGRKHGKKLIDLLLKVQGFIFIQLRR